MSHSSALKTASIAEFDAPTSGGLLDPTIGIRYSSPQQLKGWNYVLEAAVKIAVQGREQFQSTGETDYGVQATLQRFGEHHAWYASASAVLLIRSPRIDRNRSPLMKPEPPSLVTV